MKKKTFVSILLMVIFFWGLHCIFAGPTDNPLHDNPWFSQEKKERTTPEHQRLTREQQQERIIRQQQMRTHRQPAMKKAPNRIIVKFKKNREATARTALATITGKNRLKHLKHLPLSGAHVYKLTEPGQRSTILRQLRSNPAVEYAEPDFPLTLLAARFPIDPRFNESWGLHNTGQTGGTPDDDIDAPEAWGITTGSSNVVVAVVDTGIQYDHEDLAANMWQNPGETPGDGIDNDGNGYIDDIYGIDAITGSGDPSDTDGHGTQCSGIIGAVGNNTLGTSGVCWEVKLMALKTWSDTPGTASDAVECIQYAIDNGAHIINCSWECGGYSQILYDAMAQARDAGILVVTPVPYSFTDLEMYPRYPACFDLDNLLSVTSRSDNWFGAYGLTSVDVSAPGDQILTTFPNNSYGVFTGSSAAAAHASGVAALVKTLNPAATWGQMKTALMNSVVPDEFWRHRTVTGGKINAYYALLNDAPPTVSFIQPTDISIVSGTVPVQVNAADDNGITQVNLYIDDIQVANLTAPPWEWNWDTANYTEERYTVTVEVYDYQDRGIRERIRVKVNNKATPGVMFSNVEDYDKLPVVANIEATAVYSQGITKVEYFFNSTKIGEATASPYQITWDSSTFTSGSYDCLIARAHGSDGTISEERLRIYLTVVKTIPQSERDALIALYNSTNGDDWYYNQNWKKPGGDFNDPGTENSWYGVTVEYGNVTEIGLESNNLTGTLPPEIGNLRHVYWLALWNNQIGGSIPPEIGNMTYLEMMELGENQLTGTIPDEIANLEMLWDIWLDDNQLSGSIPLSVTNINSLWYLYMANNQFSGPLPTELAEMPVLGYLDLSGNQLTGTIPSQLGHSNRLKNVTLSRNRLEGSIPVSLLTCSGLDRLKLDGNQFSGPIPPEVTQLEVQGSYFNINYNKLYCEAALERNFLDNLSPGWETTQTTTPSAVSATAVSADSVRVGWVPIAYTTDNGGYKVLYGTVPGGPYSEAGTTADKSASSFEVNGLTPGTPYYFAVQAVTLPHTNNPNTVVSSNSDEISGVIQDTYTLSVRSEPVTGIPVTVSPADNNGYSDGNTDFTRTYNRGAQVTLTAPAVHNGDDFIGWRQGNNFYTDPQIQIPAGGSPVLTAVYKPGPPPTVTSPNGGESLGAGGTHVITWETPITISRVDIAYSLDNGQQWVTIINGANNSGAYTWNLPTVVSSQCLIRVSDTDGSAADTSDAVFSINSLPLAERNALIDFYNSTNGDSWYYNSNWKKDGQFNDIGTESTWYGIQISNNHVVGISLYYANLDGSIPASIANLTHLEVLRLYGNTKLTGGIPPELGSLTALTEIDFHNSYPGGTIPTELGNLENLQTLNLEYCGLTGSFPSQLGNLSKLDALLLTGNELSGTIPTEVGNLSSLRTLTLKYNQMTGTIPLELCNLPLLETLDLSSNDLTGTIPTQMQNLSSLRDLDLYGNQLSGSIPPELGNLPSLEYLDLCANQLTGTIPPELGNLANLEMMDLEINQLTGIIPPELGNLSHLSELYLGFNSLEGELPSQLGNLPRMEYLYVTGNKMSGPIPTSLMNYEYVGNIGLRFNLFYSNDSELSAFLDENAGGWSGTQTVPPENVTLSALSSTSVRVSWTPIDYSHHSGHYKILYGTASGGPYTEAGTTADKTVSSFDVTALTPGTQYYFVLQTQSDPHDENVNTLLSEYSNEVSFRIDNTYTISVTSVPDTGVPITVSPVDNNGNGDGSTDFSRTFTLGTTVTLTAPATVGENNFSKWIVDGAQLDTQTIQFNVGNHHNISVLYEPQAQAPSIRVISPNGGEIWKIGRVHSVVWETTGEIGNVKIEYSYNNGTTWYTLTSSTANTGSYPWSGAFCTISHQYLVRISSIDGTRSDTSDGPFSIIGSRISETDRQVLIQLYNSTNGDNWLSNTNWKLENGDFNLPGTESTWRGITISDARVAKILLTNLQLSGSLPDALTNLTALEELRLNNNAITGTVPENLGNLSQLKILHLQYNQFSGAIPESIGNCAALEELFIGNNQLTGSIPAPLVNCSQLKNIDLQYNQLTGTIPDNIGNYTALTGFNVRHNQMTGPIPENIGNCTALLYLYLGNNRFTGSVPATLGNISPLRVLDLRSNQLTGPVPVALMNLVNVRADGSSINFNALYTDDENLKQYLDARFVSWDQYQTIAPEDVAAQAVSGDTIRVSWTPIPYTIGTGFYRVLYSTTPGGPYSEAGTTAGKTVSQLDVNGLSVGTDYYFVVQTRTEADIFNENAVESDYSAEVSANIPLEATLSVITPNGGETWQVGSQQTITWGFSGSVGNVKLEYSTSGISGTYTTIIESTANSGSYSWTIPDVDSTQCVVRITDGDGNPSDTSNAVFTIEPVPSVTVTTPNGGEQWAAGTSQVINWAYENMTGDIIISIYRGEARLLDLATVPVTDETFTWIIPATFTPATDYRIRMLQGAVSEDYSDAYFSIIPSVHPDFNSDGSTDLLWRNKATGQNGVWMMNGTTRTNIVFINTLSISWESAGTADFNGDGKTDIMWRNKTTGQNGVWMMNGTTRTNIIFLPTLGNTNWYCGGLADFNGDGKTDIMWRDRTTGQNGVWMMNGTSRTTIVFLPVLGDTNWICGGLGDFNNDGKPDILWRNQVTGENGVWMMNGTKRTSIVFLPRLSDTNWQCAEVGDFNGDRKPDILWRHRTTGENGVWFMNGTTRTGQAYLKPLSDTNWELGN